MCDRCSLFYGSFLASMDLGSDPKEVREWKPTSSSKYRRSCEEQQGLDSTFLRGVTCRPSWHALGLFSFNHSGLIDKGVTGGWMIYFTTYRIFFEWMMNDLINTPVSKSFSSFPSRLCCFQVRLLRIDPSLSFRACKNNLNCNWVVCTWKQFNCMRLGSQRCPEVRDSSVWQLLFLN
jgi:hypothetical protein